MKNQFSRDEIKEFDDLIAKRVQELCTEKKMTQYKIHKKSGIAKSSISNFFNRTTKTNTTATLKKICSALDISIAEFFNHEYFM